MRYFLNKLNFSKKVGVFSLFLICVLLFGIIPITSSYISEETQIHNTALVSTGNIVCTGDTQCDSTLSGFSGDGSANNPYTIEGYAVSGTIQIFDTTRHIKIRGNSISSAGIGIQLKNISGSIIIENNNISTIAEFGIYARTINSTFIIRGNIFVDTQTWAVWIGENNPSILSPVNSLEMHNNTFSGVERGLIAYQIDIASIYNNTFSSVMFFPLEIGYTNDTTIHDNQIFNSGYGMRINQNDQILVANNTIRDLTNPSGSGIYEYVFNDPQLYNRTYVNNTIHNVEPHGLELHSYSSAINNTITGIGYHAIKAGTNNTIIGNFISDYSHTTGFVAIDAGKNSTINKNSIIHGTETAIRVDSNSTLSNNVIDNITGYGIDAFGAGDVTISDNTISNTAFDAIRAYSGTISSNQISNSIQNGIYVSGGSGSVITGNTISHSGGSGIYLLSTTDVIVSSNNINNSTLFSIYSRSSPTSTMTDNVLTDSIGLDSANILTKSDITGYTFSGNTINGDPFGYFDGHSSNITGTYGQIYVVESTNIALVGVTITTTNRPLTIMYCTSITVEGVSLIGKEGYALWNVGLQSSLTITESTFTSNKGVAIIAEGSVDIINTQITQGESDALHLQGHGTIFGSTISNNDGVGIRVFGNGYTITDTTFDSNQGYAILIENGASNNLIHHNNFLNNNPSGSFQAYDNGTFNVWYDAETMEGNHWSDYSGSGSHPIGGPNFVEDIYPLDLIVFPRITDTPSSNPSASSDPSSVPFSSDDPSDTQAGFLYSPQSIFIVMFFTSFIAILRQRMK